MKTFTSLLLMAFSVTGLSQTFELNFTAIDSATYAQLDSIKIMNRTQGGDTVLYWPDTTLVLYHVGIQENSNTRSNFQLHQNYPNPVLERTTLSVCVPERDKLRLTITDALGRQLLNAENICNRGCHEFNFITGNAKIYFVTASWKGTSQTIKILNAAHGKNRPCSLEYKGSGEHSEPMKSSAATQSFSFTEGDELLYIGYSNSLQSGLLDSPEESKTYTFQFATNIPCIGLPTVDYEGQTYNTIQIFSQCWLKENLNVGTMIYAPQAQLDNDTIEKYCMGNNPAECDNYGGVYMWDELMQYSTKEGVQGICPPGWHIPTDEEWKLLEGAVDSQYGIGNTIWKLTNERGFDAGKNLKSTSSWYNEGNGVDAFGFTAFSGGYYYSGVGWAGGTLFAPFYTSSHIEIGEETKPYDRGLSWVWTKISRNYDIKEHAKPVRCLKNAD